MARFDEVAYGRVKSNEVDGDRRLQSLGLRGVGQLRLRDLEANGELISGGEEWLAAKLKRLY
jgi:hypothetical protein